MGRKTNISKHLSEAEIKRIYKGSIYFKDKLRLLAVINLYKGKTMYDTADYLMISYSNLKKFIKRWNEEGLCSLEKSNCEKLNNRTSKAGIGSTELIN